MLRQMRCISCLCRAGGGQISDVILDSAGALAGVLVLAAVRKLIKRKQNFRKAVYVRK